MKTLRTHRSRIAALFLLLTLSVASNAQFKPVGPPPYSATVARQKIRTLLGKTDPGNRQQTIATISGLLNWYRDIADDELVAVWKKDDGRENLPEVITALADARVASAVVEFSWRQRRQATFQLADAPMFGNLMLRFPDSAKPFLDDLLGAVDAASIQPPLSEPEAYAVCRILLDMPDIGTWRKSALQILPHYREAAETLLAADLNQGDQEKRTRAMYWTAALKSNTSGASGQTARRNMPPAAQVVAPQSDDGPKSGTLECSGDPIPQGAEYVFPNVTTSNRRFEYDRKTWDVFFVPGQGGMQNMILKNKSSRPQKRCVVRWTVVP